MSWIHSATLQGVIQSRDRAVAALDQCSAGVHSLLAESLLVEVEEVGVRLAEWNRETEQTLRARLHGLLALHGITLTAAQVQRLGRSKLGTDTHPLADALAIALWPQSPAPPPLRPSPHGSVLAGGRRG